MPSPFGAMQLSSPRSSGSLPSDFPSPRAPPPRPEPIDAWSFDAYGLTALHHAVLAESEDTARLEQLLRHGASPFLRARPPRRQGPDYSGHSALALAARRERAGSIRLLTLAAAGAYLRAQPVPEPVRLAIDALTDWSLDPLRYGDAFEARLQRFAEMDAPLYLMPAAASALGEVARTGLRLRLEWLLERPDRLLPQLHEEISYIEARLFALGGAIEAPYVGQKRLQLHRRARLEGASLGQEPSLAFRLPPFAAPQSTTLAEGMDATGPESSQSAILLPDSFQRDTTSPFERSEAPLRRPRPAPGYRPPEVSALQVRRSWSQRLLARREHAPPPP